MDGFPTMGIPDTGDTAWMLVSSAMVLLMTPGLAFFYGGMVRAKSVLNMIMMSVSAMGVVTVLWVLYGYSLAFGNDVGNLFGDPTQFFGLKGLIGGNGAEAVIADPAAGIEAADALNIPLVFTFPATVFVAFQLMFAIITVALISGAVADRIKFGGWLLFSALWVTIVYFPVAHWVFAFDGVHRRDRRLDRQQARGDRLRRWHSGSHQRRYRRAGSCDHPRQAQGLAAHADAAAQPAVRHARCWPAVVRLVRVQRGFGNILQRNRGVDDGDHHGRHRGRDAGMAAHGTHP